MEKRNLITTYIDPFDTSITSVNAVKNNKPHGMFYIVQSEQILVKSFVNKNKVYGEVVYIRDIFKQQNF